MAAGDDRPDQAGRFRRPEASRTVAGGDEGSLIAQAVDHRR